MSLVKTSLVPSGDQWGRMSLALCPVTFVSVVPPMSVIGASVVGAVTNNAVQIYVFALFFTGGSAPRELMGTFIIIGAVVGFVTGLLSAELLKKVALERST